MRKYKKRNNKDKETIMKDMIDPVKIAEIVNIND